MLKFQKKIKCQLSNIQVIEIENDLSEICMISKNFRQLDTVGFTNYLFFTPLKRLATSLDITIRRLIIMMLGVDEYKRQNMITNLKLLPIEDVVNKKKKKSKNKKKNTKLINYEDIAMSVMETILEKLEEEFELLPKKKKKKKKKKKSKIVEPPSIPNDNYSDSNSLNSCHEAKKIEIPQIYSNLNPQKNCNINKKTQKKNALDPAFPVEPPKLIEPSPISEFIPDSTKQPFLWNKSHHPTNQNLDINDFPPLSVDDNSLHAEILSFCKALDKKVNEKYERFSLSLNILINIIRESFPVDNISIYGSHSTKIALESSDIDLVVRLSELPNMYEVKYWCDLLADKLSKCHLVIKCEPIKTSKVPVVKIVTEQYPLDITFESKGNTHHGLLTSEFTKTSLLMNPNLREIYLVCKQLLSVNGLNSSYTRGVSSYGLFIWVLSFFNKTGNKEQDLGQILLSFLHYFGVEFNPNVSYIDVRFNGSTLPLEKEPSGNLITSEPHSGENITANCYRIADIQQLFVQTHDKIIEMKLKPSNQSILSYIFKLQT